MPAGTAAERVYREKLLAQRGHLLSLCADLRELASDDSVRPDAARLPHLEAAAQLDAVEARLGATDGALGRLAAGRFGLCVECGDAIPAERLEARPDAHLCVPCCRGWSRSDLRAVN